uniref:Uncharacterized protein n=1 Tax=Manihot esculenta TaxID=3983 RepID=A0A2C9WAS6_MANES
MFICLRNIPTIAKPYTLYHYFYKTHSPLSSSLFSHNSSNPMKLQKYSLPICKSLT